MKKTLIALTLTLLLCGQSQVFAQDTFEHRIYVKKSAAYPDNNGDRLHKISNDFADEVGDMLKEHYPMKILVSSLSIKMECYHDTVRLTYQVQLINCSKDSAQYYFKHSGSMNKDTRPYVAVVDAETKCADQALVVKRQFKTTHHFDPLVDLNIYIDESTECGKYTYALSEYFISARK